MTLEQIRVFVAIAETGSLGAAAKKLHRTQPSLSVAVKKLEEQLETPLFSRAGYRMQLTEQGRRMLRSAQRLLHQAQEFESLGLFLSQGNEPELRVSIDPMIPLAPILEILRPFEQDHCQTQLVLVSQYMYGGIEKLIQGEVDLAFVVWPNLDHRVEGFKVFDLEMLMVVSPQFPLLTTQKTLSESDLMAFPQVVIQDSAVQRRSEQFGVLEGGRKWEVTDVMTKKEIILAGLGWGNLPSHLIQRELGQGLLLNPPTSGLENRDQGAAHLIKRKGSPLGPIAQQLWQEFKQRLV
ncbi:MAG: LysR family transcriptional regulator [bacterium]|nr:LysR family transcriptional regulator [bacterium]